MSQEKIDIIVIEEVECFRDRWDYSTENHYTDEWLEECETVYHIDLEVNEDGDIVETEDEIEKKLIDVIQGKLISFRIL